MASGINFFTSVGGELITLQPIEPYHGKKIPATISGYRIASAELFGATLESATVSGGVLLTARNGGTVYKATINYGGKLTVSSGGVANSTTIAGGGVTVSSGGVANSTTIAGGTAHIRRGATANNTTVSSGGSLCISSGGIVSGGL